MELLPRLDPDEVRRLDRAHVFHSWSAQDLIDPPAIVSARGSRFTDHTGREYLDFASQLVNINLGHQHPRIVAAIQEQAAHLCTVAPAVANGARSEAVRDRPEAQHPERVGERESDEGGSGHRNAYCRDDAHAEPASHPL